MLEMLFTWKKDPLCLINGTHLNTSKTNGLKDYNAIWDKFWTLTTCEGIARLI